MTDFEAIFKYPNPGIYEEKNITFVVNNLGDIIVFTLYGQDIDKLILESITARAIDQKEYADETTKKVFYLIFKEEIKIEYNLRDPLLRERVVANLRNLYSKYSKQKKSIDELIKEFEEKEKDIIAAEIDGKLIFEGIENEDDMIEMKLYTCPDGERVKALKRHLQDKQLARYFKNNRYIAVMGFSYIKDPTLYSPSDSPIDNLTDNPLPYGRDGKFPYGLSSIWAINVSFMNSNILTVKPNSTERANLILDQANLNLLRLTKKLGLRPKGLFFKNTVNLVKVHQMGQIIESYKQKNEQLKNSLQEAEQKIEAMERTFEQKIEAMERAWKEEKEAMERAWKEEKEAMEREKKT